MQSDPHPPVIQQHFEHPLTPPSIIAADSTVARNIQASLQRHPQLLSACVPPLLNTMRTLSLLGYGAIVVGALLPWCNASSSCSTAGVNGYTAPSVNCSTYHPELSSSQKYCYMANQAGIISGGLSFSSVTFTCPYGLNVDQFSINYYDSTSSDGTLSADFDLGNGAGSDVSDNASVSPGTCLDWTNDFALNPSLDSVTWGFSSGGRTHGLLIEYAMYCTQPPATPAPTTTITSTTGAAGASATASGSQGSATSSGSSSSSGSARSGSQKTGSAAVNQVSSLAALAVAVGLSVLV